MGSERAGGRTLRAAWSEIEIARLSANSSAFHRLVAAPCHMLGKNLRNKKFIFPDDLPDNVKKIIGSHLKFQSCVQLHHDAMHTQKN